MAMSDQAAIRIEICRSSKRWPLRRPQRWFWVAVNAGNGRAMASGETYTNIEDCVDAAVQLFGDGRRVWLRQPGRSDVILREMAE